MGLRTALNDASLNASGGVPVKALRLPSALSGTALGLWIARFDSSFGFGVQIEGSDFKV